MQAGSTMNSSQSQSSSAKETTSSNNASTSNSNNQSGLPFQSSFLGGNPIQLAQYLMELNLNNFEKSERRMILKFAAENLLFFPTIIDVEHGQELLGRFNKSWSNYAVWSDTFSSGSSIASPHSMSVFVELLGLVFNVSIL